MPLRQTRIARSEMDLKGSVDDLVAAVKGKWGQLTATDTPFYSLLLAVDLVGEHCLKLPMNCLGDTGDADYQISETVDIDSGEVLAVLGTLGTLTGNAVYSSLSVNRIPELVGAANHIDTDLAGSSGPQRTPKPEQFFIATSGLNLTLSGIISTGPPKRRQSTGELDYVYDV
jgi:hypothetical protein